MTSLPRCSATTMIGSDTWVFSRMIGQVHIATRSVGNRRTTSAQIATAIDICTTIATAVRDAAWLTATVMPIPSSVPKIRPARDDRVSCKYSCETTTAEIAAQRASCNPSEHASWYPIAAAPEQRRTKANPRIIRIGLLSSTVLVALDDASEADGSAN